MYWKLYARHTVVVIATKVCALDTATTTVILTN
jgi:hypothetical protein